MSVKREREREREGGRRRKGREKERYRKEGGTYKKDRLFAYSFISFSVFGTVFIVIFVCWMEELPGILEGEKGGIGGEEGEGGREEREGRGRRGREMITRSNTPPPHQLHDGSGP